MTVPDRCLSRSHATSNDLVSVEGGFPAERVAAAAHVDFNIFIVWIFQMRIMQRSLLAASFWIVGLNAYGQTAIASVATSTLSGPLQKASSENGKSLIDVALSYDSAFWRTEYLPSDDEKKAEGEAGQNADANGLSVGSDGHSQTHAASSIDAALEKLIQSDTIELATTAMPTPTSNTLGSSDSGEDSNPIEGMSDWEFAASEATDNATIGATASGPSATSAIVGIVGVLIVIGAYVSSSGGKTE